MVESPTISTHWDNPTISHAHMTRLRPPTRNCKPICWDLVFWIPSVPMIAEPKNLWNFNGFSSRTTAPLQNVTATFYSMGRSGYLRHCGSVGSQGSLFALAVAEKWYLSLNRSLAAANQPSRKTVERHGACFVTRRKQSVGSTQAREL